LPSSIHAPLLRMYLRDSRKSGCTFGVAKPLLQSIVMTRSFCLRVFAFPFGFAFAISPEPVIRLLLNYLWINYTFTEYQILREMSRIKKLGESDGFIRLQTAKNVI